MREIEFRGKRIDNGEWVYGYYVGYSEAMGYIYGDYVDKKEVWQVDPKTVGQWTGLMDLKKVKVFEGDIVEYEGYEVDRSTWKQLRPKKRVVVGRDNFFRDVYVLNNLMAGYPDRHEVIGNIYEHPNLIKQDTK